MLTVYITLKSGKTEINAAQDVKFDVASGVILLNYGRTEERIISASLVRYIEVESK